MIAPSWTARLDPDAAIESPCFFSKIIPLNQLSKPFDASGTVR